MAEDSANCMEKNRLLEEKIAQQESVISNLDSIVTYKDQVINKLSKEKERLFNLWSQENLKRHKAENSPRLGSWLPWAIAGAFAISTATLAFVTAVK